MHVIEQVAVEGPVALLVRGKVEGSAASWLHDHRMLLWLPVRRRAVDQFEEMAVQMDRVRHHRIVDEFHTDTFVIGEANGVVANGSKRSEEHTSELQSLMRLSYAVFCLKKK